LPIYEWKRKAYLYGRDDIDSDEETTTQGSIHAPVPRPEDGNPEFYDPWERVYTYQVGKVSGVGDSPSRSVKSQ
jgi:hypothetical protein